MTDREKIIKGLECCTQPSCECADDCPYSKAKRNVWMTCCDVLMDDALALLKAQEPMKPSIGGDADVAGNSWWYTCGVCRGQIDKGDKFCRWCGQAVKWE